MRPNSLRSRRGFTLVEMLVVITIIGILVALLIPTIAGVMRRARNAAISIEIQDIARAVEAYKSKNNDFFPDFTNRAAVVNHIRTAFPRNTRNVAAWLATPPPVTTPPTPDPRTLDAAEALVFWLSMLSTNIRDPLNTNGERAVFYKFDETRMLDIDNDGWKEFYCKSADRCPLVYFDGRLITVPNTSPPPAGQPALIATYAYAWALYPSPYGPANLAPDAATLTRSFLPPAAPTSPVGVARPFRSNLPIDATRDNFRTWPYGPGNPSQWMTPGLFQIVCAGQDNLFGPDISTAAVTFKTYPTPNYQLAGVDDEDNLANFSERTIGDSVP
jgi:prepilin-type N-terminal cleavage/methylation domain-containing protein